MKWWIKCRDLVIKRSNYRLNRLIKLINCRPWMNLSDKTNKQKNYKIKTTWAGGNKVACEENQLDFKVFCCCIFDKRSSDFSEKNNIFWVFTIIYSWQAQCLLFSGSTVISFNWFFIDVQLLFLLFVCACRMEQLCCYFVQHCSAVWWWTF